MHYHLEVIMPPTNDVKGAIDKILEPFSEHNEEASLTFWDWWQIGGRFAGQKAEGHFPHLRGDISTLKEVNGLSAHRVIIAGPSYDDSIEARFMIAQSEWNGVTHIDTKWDGKVTGALEMFREQVKGYKDEWQEKHLPKDDWLAVTVDYHS